MTQCDACKADGVQIRTLSEYAADLSVGLPNIVLYDAVQSRICAACGKDYGVAIPDEDGLEAAIAVARSVMPYRFDGRTIRFMRRSLGLLAKDLANCLMVRSETVSRWENDHEPMSPEHEKLLRFFVGANLGSATHAVDFDLDALMRMDMNELPTEQPRLEFRRVKVRVHQRRIVEWDCAEARAA